MARIDPDYPPLDPKKVTKATLFIIGSLILLLIVSVFVAGGCREYNRYQKRADAENQVKITHIQIRKAQQQAQINRAQIKATIAEAQKKREEAKGIRDAQDIINETLTPLYIQHEAIQAQKAVATSGNNNTIIYSPAGSNGVPLVQTPPTNTGVGQGK